MIRTLGGVSYMKLFVDNVNTGNEKSTTMDDGHNDVHI